MARGTTLLALIGQLKAECGLSTSVSVGVDKMPEWKQILARTQASLYSQHEWPHLMKYPSLALTAGTRYYDMPSGVEYEGILDIANLSTGEPIPMIREIGFEQYAIYSSDDDERADPATHWDIKDNSNAVQIEVWPIPVAAQTCMVKARRTLRPLIADADVADLDDTLIVLFAAAEILARMGSEDAERKAALASARLAAIGARSRGNPPVRNMTGVSGVRPGRGQVTIRVGS